MRKYKNSKFKVSFVDFISLIILMLLSFISGFYTKNTRELEDLFNISKTNIDYIVQMPSEEQIEEIKTLDHVNEIVPYIYMSLDAKINDRIVGSNLYFIENISLSNYTIFSDELLIDKTINTHEISAYITEDYANNNNLRLDDQIIFMTVSGNIKVNVAAIYESDHRALGGSILIEYNDKLLDSLFNDRSHIIYSGAFISSNDILKTKTYLKNYMPKGNLKDQSDFKTEAEYNSYLEYIYSIDYSYSIFSTENYIDELHNRHDSAILRNKILSYVFLFSCLVSYLIFMILKFTKYFKRNIFIDKKNNYSFKQESGMFARYYLMMIILSIICLSISLILEMLLLKNNIFVVRNYILFINLILFSFFVMIKSILSIKKEFYK